MVNLTSFSFGLLPPDSPSIAQLLDFFQSAPRIREIDLLHTAPIPGSQDGRLISLASLQKMVIVSKPIDSDYEHHFPRSLDNLKKLSNFTTVNLGFNSSHSEFQFIGPTGELTIIFEMCRVDVSAILDYVARFDSSKVERLWISGSGSPDPNVVHRAFLPMQNLHTLTVCKYTDQQVIIHALSSQSQTSSVLLCSKLEELALCPEEGEEKSAIQTLSAMAASRALRGAMLKTVRILKSRDRFDPEDVLEFEKHVSEAVFDP